MRNRKPAVGGLAAIAVMFCALALAPPGALAKDGDIRVAGTCTKASSSKLKLSAEGSQIEIEFEVDQNRVGRKWTVVLRRNGAVVRRLTKVTRAPSGSFEARFVTGNQAGADRFAAVASRPGEVCTARAAI